MAPQKPPTNTKRGKTKKTKTPKDPNTLPPKEHIFCQEYIIDFNGARAARTAGYSEKTADKQAYQLLEKPRVHAEITRLISERVKRTQITADRVLLELASIAFADLREFGQWDDEGRLSLIPSENLAPAQTRAVRTVKFTRVKKKGFVEEEHMEFSLHDKLSALDKLAKHVGLYRDSGDNGKQSGLMQLAELMAARRAEHTSRRSGDEG